MFTRPSKDHDQLIGLVNYVFTNAEITCSRMNKLLGFINILINDYDHYYSHNYVECTCKHIWFSNLLFHRTSYMYQIITTYE